MFNWLKNLTGLFGNVQQQGYFLSKLCMKTLWMVSLGSPENIYGSLKYLSKLKSSCGFFIRKFYLLKIIWPNGNGRVVRNVVSVILRKQLNIYFCSVLLLKWYGELPISLLHFPHLSVSQICLGIGLMGLIRELGLKFVLGFQPYVSQFGRAKIILCLTILDLSIFCRLSIWLLTGFSCGRSSYRRISRNIWLLSATVWWWSHWTSSAWVAGGILVD